MSALSELFKDIADAIRSKTGSIATMKPAEFPEKISGITVGGDTTEIDTLLDEINGEVIGERVLGQGSCGASATYMLKDSGLLTISGRGEITSTPWRDIENFKTVIRKVVIADGITNVPVQAFQECSNLTEATLSNTTVSIELAAFYQAGLKSITIPASVKGIYEMAFIRCNSMMRATFEDIQGWEVRKSTGELIATPLPSNLNVSTIAAEYLRDNESGYASYRWLKT